MGAVGAEPAAPLLLALPGRWPVRLLQVLLLGAAAEWVRTAARLAAGRMAAGEPWLRLAAILAAVAAVTSSPPGCRAAPHAGAPRTHPALMGSQWRRSPSPP